MQKIAASDIARIISTLILIFCIWMNYSWALKFSVTLCLVGGELTTWWIRLLAARQGAK